jgi:hypothetical protein
VIHILDANTLMEASRTYYAFDLAPNFWEWLRSSGVDGQVASVDRVRQEIAAGHGDLVDWSNDLRGSFWLPETDESIASATDIVKWANEPERPYIRAAIDEFMDSADLQLIAHARVVSGVVVTREQSHPEARKRVMIPDVCAAFDVTCIDPFETYRQLGLRLC